MSLPRGIDREQARALAGLLKLVLSSPDLDDDTERRARWLWLRIVELFPEKNRPPFDFIEARIAAMLSREATRRAAA